MSTHANSLLEATARAMARHPDFAEVAPREALVTKLRDERNAAINERAAAGVERDKALDLAALAMVNEKKMLRHLQRVMILLLVALAFIFSR